MSHRVTAHLLQQESHQRLLKFSSLDSPLFELLLCEQERGGEGSGRTGEGRGGRGGRRGEDRGSGRRGGRGGLEWLCCVSLTAYVSSNVLLLLVDVQQSG